MGLGPTWIPLVNFESDLDHHLDTRKILIFPIC